MLVHMPMISGYECWSGSNENWEEDSWLLLRIIIAYPVNEAKYILYVNSFWIIFPCSFSSTDQLREYFIFARNWIWQMANFYTSWKIENMWNLVNHWNSGDQEKQLSLYSTYNIENLNRIYKIYWPVSYKTVLGL